LQQQRADGGEPSAPAKPGLLLLSYTTPRDAAWSSAGMYWLSTSTAIRVSVRGRGCSEVMFFVSESTVGDSC
jgi:hypothetical protein